MRIMKFYEPNLSEQYRNFIILIEVDYALKHAQRICKATALRNKSRKGQ